MLIHDLAVDDWGDLYLGEGDALLLEGEEQPTWLQLYTRYDAVQFSITARQ